MEENKDEEDTFWDDFIGSEFENVTPIQQDSFPTKQVERLSVFEYLNKKIFEREKDIKEYGK